jgi:hypothetical protein
MEAFGVLPDGTKKWLLLIKDWDLNWQGDYRYAQPVFLPRGTRITQVFSYDNSSDNVRNPHNPPQRVKHGIQATDEMGSIWLQVLPRHPADLGVLRRHYGARVLQEVAERSRATLRQSPKDLKAHIDLGKVALAAGQLDACLQLFRNAVLIELSGSYLVAAEHGSRSANSTRRGDQPRRRAVLGAP